MIDIQKFTLDNGLTVVVNEDKTTPFIAFNMLYDVGSKDENPDKTGFAHLFEHLMFGGSKNIPNFDEPLQRVGAENNAFTNTDITNYYITIPKENIETAFWLESDRMLCLDFSQRNLDIQKNVVCEEFRQRYLNKPYGDTWLLLRPLAYKKHPYQWATIGKDISHIEQATLNDVKDFFYRYYAPNNAVLSISGNISVNQVKLLAEKWFGPIERRKVPYRNIPQEPLQTEKRELTVHRNVPYPSIYKTFKMCKRLDNDYYTTDLISDILSNGKSSRLYKKLVQEKKLFSDINAYITGEMEEGLFVFSGNAMNGVDIFEAEKAINEEIEKLKNGFIFDYELSKVKNKIESTIQFSETNILNKAMNIAKYELFGDANLVNSEFSNYAKVQTIDIKRIANELFVENNSSTLYYLPQ